MNNQLILICLISPFIIANDSHSFDKRGDTPMAIHIQSTAFSEGGLIPLKYTCDGDDVSPPLSWDSAPAGTESFALICDDSDAPAGTWVHWVVYDLPKQTRFLHEDFTDQSNLEDGTKQGITDFKQIGYGGPCPPGGTHRYFFKIFALKIKLALRERVWAFYC